MVDSISQSSRIWRGTMKKTSKIPSGNSLPPVTRGSGPPALPRIPIATRSFRPLYLFAFATQHEVVHFLRTQALEQERERQAEIMRAWELLQPRVAALINGEANVANTAEL